MTPRFFVDPDERIVLSIHRHPFAFLPAIAMLSVMAVLPLLIFFIIDTATDFVLPSSVLPWVAVGFGAFYLFWIMLGLVLWMDYYYDMYIVTESHILDIDQQSLLMRKVSHTSLMRVQDVTARVKGFWGNLLDFGPVTVQTAGHEEEITLEDVPHPNEIATKIMDLHDVLIKREQRAGEIGEAEGVHSPTK